MHPLLAFRSPRMARQATLACAISAVLALPAHAATFTEMADAGETLASAQVTVAGAGALSNIFGSLQSSTDADLYVVTIADPAGFSATTLNATGGFLDTQLFLLTTAGAPVALNDDDAGGLSALSTLPAGRFASITAGTYLLGVAMSGYDPININGQFLFAAGLPTSVREPAPWLQPAALGGFADNTFGADSGAYDVQLTGAAAAAVPEPASSLLFAAGGALWGLARSRRRGRTHDT